MKRLLSVLACLAVPVAAAAQVAPPPPPPPPPDPVVVALPPIPPLPPMPRVVIPDIDPIVREAIAAARVIDTQSVREAVEQARTLATSVDVVSVREAAEAAAQSVRSMAPVDFHFEGVSLFQPFGRMSDHQDPGGSYTNGLNALQQRQYERAITHFDRVITQKSPRADAAHYHKAYAQYRNGQVQEALATIAALRRDFPQSPYVEQAKVLETDVRKTPPQDIVDDELKVLAISAMQHSDPERAVPLLEGVLQATNSLRVKRQALYVLALNKQPRARQILLSYAKGAGIPDLQLTAIQYLAANRDQKTTAQELREIYNATNDVRVKAAIINAHQRAGHRGELMAVVSSPTAPTVIRQQAVSGLAGIMTPQELYGLYEKEQDRSLRIQIVRALGSMRAVEQLNQVVRTEKDPEVRRQAIRSLGGLKADQSGAGLVDLYTKETAPETRRAIISALASQQNAEALIQIARTEKSLDLSREIVRQLTDMAPRSKVAAEYLMEIIRR